jgi:hypothetical protein
MSNFIRYRAAANCSNRLILVVLRASYSPSLSYAFRKVYFREGGEKLATSRSTLFHTYQL